MLYMEYLVSIALAFIVAFSATPIAKKLALKIGAVDVPKDDRRMHNKPIALLGGLAIVCGFLVSIVYNLLSSSDIFALNHELWGLLAGIIIIVAMGIIDDIISLRARTKLLFQIAGALAVVIISDTRISVITNPFSAQGFSELSPYVSYPLTILWIVGITNAINLIDGLDGLAAGVASISSLSLFFVSILSIGMVHDPYTSIITAALAGATLGFLPFNFNPAKIFMGETGSAFLGFTLGVISIQGMFKSYAFISIAIPLLVLGLPLFDTAFAIFRRLKGGKPIMAADRGHLHHRLIDMGLSQKQSVLVMYIASAALGLCAIVLANKGVLSAIILLISISVFVIGGARFMSEMDSGDSEHGPEENSREFSVNKAGNIEDSEDLSKKDENKSKIKMSEAKNLQNP
jgi:UDP-GlcNAc:undecaprenyl-phosphate GlcNAc-1-phosphate transferase